VYQGYEASVLRRVWRVVPEGLSCRRGCRDRGGAIGGSIGLRQSRRLNPAASGQDRAWDSMGGCRRQISCPAATC
jgi:hypothetical protein